MRKLFMLLAIVIFLVVGCFTTGSTFRDEDFGKVKLGMSESEVVSILKVNPISRSDLEDGTYLLQWMYSYGTFVGTGGARHISLLFGSDRRLIRISHQFRTGNQWLW